MLFSLTTTARHAAGDATLHLHEAVPATDAALLALLGLVLHLERTVSCDGVMQRDDRGQDLLDAEDAVAQALVVVDEVELALALLEHVEDPDAEAERLAERALQVREHLGSIALALDLPVAGEAAGIVVVPEIETGQLVQRHPLVEHGVGLPAEDLDGVPQIHQCLGEVACVHALTTHVGLAAVGEVGDLQRRLGVETLCADRGYCRHGKPRYRGGVTRR
jgi:hypothetical protein